MSWSVVAEVIGIVGQPTIVRLMPGLRPSRPGVLAFLFLVGGRRLRRSPRRFVRSLKLDHQLNQLVLAQALQFSAIHAHMDSEIGLPGKGARKSGASSRSARRKWRWVITAARTFPVVYSTDEMPDLACCIDRHQPDPGNEVGHWARQFLPPSGSIGPFELLTRLSQGINHGFRYRRREAKGIQPPVETLRLGHGSCRDFAVLLIDA